MNHIGPFTGRYRFLSNFDESPIVWQGILFSRVENAFQASKALNAFDMFRFQGLSASAAKRLGHEIECRPDWEDVKLSIMQQLVDLKFQNDILGVRLAATYPKELIEENYWHDNFWGDCKCSRPQCKEPGQNHLGKILMITRIMKCDFSS